MRDDGFTVGVVGVTGAAGAEIVRQLALRAFPCRELRLFGTTRSAGAIVEEGEAVGTVELLDEDSGRGLDVCFFAAGPEVARVHAPAFAARGALVIDTSSAFRADPAVPLIVPEVAADRAGIAERGIAALASPTTTLLAAVVGPLGTVGRVTRVVASTYQGAGTAGTRALRRLARETIAVLGGRAAGGPRRAVAFDCAPAIGKVDDAGVTAHERAVARELARVLGDDGPALQLTAVRTPVFTGLGVSMVAEFDRAVSVAEATATLRAAPGLLVHGGDDVPTLRDVAGSPAVHVGRIRTDASHPAAIALWAAADGVVQCRGAGAVAAAEMMLRARAG